MLSYPVNLMLDDNGTYLVTSQDIPELTAVGDNEQEALLNAVEALEAAMEIYFDQKRPIPMPSSVTHHQSAVELSALVTAKVLLMNEMLQQNIRKAELARRLEVFLPQVDRLLNLRHSTKLDFIERAYSKLGKKIHIEML
ncbi:type II toxin-antitoxin system HicB family antitoxin [Pelistega suis]|uniref:Type II toxin-antitoxin system HicB family antitoxin n=1 Tax=Pelistega suis TaxID=1631957 RepID=A0A849P7S7_9BURK|nr:type II toxin-antitoxin system HicB family antitoxin [Pelistega suis]NOL51825.1 type II toxin-antitoxin system HicB family antitoxin [Pelistega suis]